jgi:hypothetical protein
MIKLAVFLISISSSAEIPVEVDLLVAMRRRGRAACLQVRWSETNWGQVSRKRAHTVPAELPNNSTELIVKQIQWSRVPLEKPKLVTQLVKIFQAFYGT